jgi:pimeloyl-ACP methyl ester carboxylesterase
MTKHWRLLDDRNYRHAWGSREACEAVLLESQPDQVIPNNRVTILLHGLGRTSSSMKGLANYLNESGPQLVESPADGSRLAPSAHGQIICLDYASSRDSIAYHAAALRDVVRGLPEDVKLNFVGHSMGNIVVRHAIGDWQRSEDAATLARLEHVVMLGPPNQGASIARQLARTGVFGWIAGQGGLELGKNWSELELQLATPPCPFGIIAGRLASTAIKNPLVEGEGDFVVSVEETKLPGESDFLEVPLLHSFLMDDLAVQQAVATFLLTSRFK